MYLIDGEKLISVFAERKEAWRGNGVLPSNESLMWLAAMDITSNAPTVDAVPITRCKDCKWYDAELHCKLNGYSCGRSPDWFCADGKKEEASKCTFSDTAP